MVGTTRCPGAPVVASGTSSIKRVSQSASQPSQQASRTASQQANQPASGSLGEDNDEESNQPGFRPIALDYDIHRKYPVLDTMSSSIAID